MKQSLSVSLLSLLFFVAAAQAQAPAAEAKTNYAVVNLKTTNGVTEGESELITDRLRSELFSTGRVNVMERGQMQEILKEQGFQASGACTDEACLVEMGQMLGVKVLVVGSLGKLGSMFLVNVRSIDVQTAQIIKVVSVDIKGDIEEVVGHLREIAEKLSGAAVTVQAAAPAEPPAAASAEVVPTPPPAPQAASETAAPAEQNEVKVGNQVLDSESDRNRNRGGIGLSFTLLPGYYRHTATETFNDTTTSYDSLIYLQFDSLLFSGRNRYYEGIREGSSYERSSTPLMDFVVRFKIRAGELFTVDLGPHFLYGSEEFTYTGSGVYSRDFSLTYMSMGVQVGLNFVKRIFPLKINAGIFADFTVPILYYEFNEEFDDYTNGFYDTYSDSDVKLSFKVVPGARVGAEIMAGPHIGFCGDFVFQWLRMDAEFDFDEADFERDDAATDITQTIGFPLFGIGMGVNFYF